MGKLLVIGAIVGAVLIAVASAVWGLKEPVTWLGLDVAVGFIGTLVP